MVMAVTSSPDPKQEAESEKIKKKVAEFFAQGGKDGLPPAPQKDHRPSQEYDEDPE